MGAAWQSDAPRLDVRYASRGLYVRELLCRVDGVGLLFPVFFVSVGVMSVGLIQRCYVVLSRPWQVPWYHTATRYS